MTEGPGPTAHAGPPRARVLAAPSDHVLAHVPGPDSLLTADERRRADRFRFDRDRRDFVAAHVLARVAGATVLGAQPQDLTLVQRCERCGEAHGVPSFAEAPGLGVSLSHTRGYVSAAAGPGRVGVDAEGTGGALRLDRALVEAVLAPAERALLAAAPGGHTFVRLWVRKEATVKAGRGSFADLPAVDVSAVALTEPAASGTCARTPEGDHLLEWHDPGREVVGAAVTEHPPDLAVLGADRPGPASAGSRSPGPVA